MAEEMDLQIKIVGENDTGGAFDSLDSAFSKLQELASSVSRSFEDFSNTLSNSFSDISKEADTTGKSIEEMMRPLFDSGVESATNALARSIGEVGTEAIKSTEEVDKLAEATKKASEAGSHGGGHGEGGIFGLQGQMDTMYAGMALGAPAMALDAGLGSAIKSMADFDSQMRQVNQEMGLSNDKFGALEQQVLNLSSATGISAKDLSAGLYNVVATGVTNTADALNLLKVSAEGAKAGNVDLNTTTKAMNAVMGAYGMSASNAGHIMDVMFTAVNNGQMHFQDLAKSVGASATSASTAGVSYEELASAQATLTNVGKNAESASQNLNSLIMGMIAPTAGATKEAKALGIEWDASALKAHGLSYMINEATKASGGNMETLKKLVPNQRAYMAVLALGTNAHKQYTDTLEKMRNANGATEEALKQTEQGAGESIDKMKANLQNAGIEIALGLAPALNSLAQKVQELASWFNTLSPTTKKVFGELALGSAVLLTLGSSFFMTLSAIGGLVSGFKAMSGMFTLVKVAEDGTKAMTGLGLAMDFLMGPVGIIIGAIALLAIGFKLAYDHIKPFHDAVNNVINTFKQLGEAIKGIWNGGAGAGKGISILDNLGFSTNAIATIQNVVRSIQNGFQIIKGAYMILTGAGGGQGIDILQKLGISKETITKLMQIGGQIKYGFDTIKSTIMDAIAVVSEWWKSHWTEIQESFVTVMKFMVGFLSPQILELTAIIAFGLGFIKGAWQSGWDAIVSALKMAWDLIKGATEIAWHALSGIITVAIDILSGNFRKAGSDFVNIFKNIWSDITTTFSSFGDDMFNFGVNLLKMLANGITSAVGSVTSAVSGVANQIKSFLGFHSPAEQGPAGRGESDMWMKNMMDMFAKDIQTNTPKIQSAVSQVALGIKTGLTMPLSQSLTSNMITPSNVGSANGLTIIVQASGNVTRNEQELGDVVSKAILSKIKMQGKF